MAGAVVDMLIMLERSVLMRVTMVISEARCSGKVMASLSLAHRSRGSLVV